MSENMEVELDEEEIADVEKLKLSLLNGLEVLGPGLIIPTLPVTTKGIVAQQGFLCFFKGAVLAEYVIDEEGETSLNLLVNTGNSYRWISADEAIPSTSEREYTMLTSVG